jgi:hypothetical protein
MTTLQQERQAIFETVARHLFAQGKPANGEYTRIVRQDVRYNATGCMYRGPDNTRCAVGVLIPDEAYRPEMEGRGAVAVLEMCHDQPWAAALYEHRHLLRALQLVHDGPVFWESTAEARRVLKENAADFKLDTKFLDDLSFADR